MIQFSLRTLKRKVKKRLSFLPVTRYEVLQYAKELQATHAYKSLCSLLGYALMDYDIYYPRPIEIIFPKFKEEYAKHFGASYYGYWWERDRWDTGRLDFLNWLINEYKDDKTDIRKL